MDEKDEMILDELRKDGRQSTSRISKKLKIPRVTVHDRMQKMVREGVISRIVAVPDYKKIGKPLTAFILIRYEPGVVKQAEVARKVAALPGVSEVYILAGEWDLVAKVRGESLEGIGKMVVDRLREVGGIARSVTMPAFVTVKEEP
ncbi:Lrp/AsnC family transcriptional regulator [Candidatus Micrarchaeota archaeon]|nr:Lrp/AsnC family transcriptional regulator [Candidatus Micrarchaeota archaeon]